VIVGYSVKQHIISPNSTFCNGVHCLSLIRVHPTKDILVASTNFTDLQD
jgi:hypothetical protein